MKLQNVISKTFDLKPFLKYHLITVLTMASYTALAQDPNEKGNLPNYYYQHLHFGFSVGINRANFIVTPAEHFERFDSLKAVTSAPKPGFNLGIVSELMLHKYLTLRFLPSLSFSERSIDFYFEGKKDTIIKPKAIESAFLNFPLDLKLRSKRVKNFSAYLLAGGGYNLDLASKRKVSNEGIAINDQIVKLKRDDFSYEAGVGAEFYLQYFKFAIEAKLTMGTLNLLIKDNTIFSNSIDKLRSKVLTISLTFEG